MTDFGSFLNSYVTDARTLWLMAALSAAFLGMFSVLYNRWMADLDEKKAGYTALLVVIGNAVTLIIVSIFSWKAALLVAVAFGIDGIAMIAGDIRRSHEKREKDQSKRPRRKALPYAACGLIDEANMLLAQVERGLRLFLENKSDDRKIGLLALMVKEASIKLTEARKVEGE